MNANKLPTAKEMLTQLIAAQSVSSVNPAIDQSNLEVIQLLAAWLTDLGFACEVMPVDSEGKKANLIASIGKGPGGFVLSGHSDTVPYDDNAWQSDPFTLTEKDDKYFGLGTCDMKGFFPVAIQAIAALDLKKLKKPLIFLATADEECTMAGARSLVAAERPVADFALIGEPTSLVPINQHKGLVPIKITLEGLSGHASRPDLGVNTIDAMQKVLAQLQKWRNSLIDRYQDLAFKLPHPTLNFGHIHGGDNSNRICGHCELHIDLRLLPSMDVDACLEELKEIVNLAIDDERINANISKLAEVIPSFHNPKTNQLIETAENLTGHQAQSVAFGTEAPFLSDLGMNTVVLGPGSIDQAHQPNEFIKKAEMISGQAIIESFIKTLCFERQIN